MLCAGKSLVSLLPNPDNPLRTQIGSDSPAYGRSQSLSAYGDARG